MTANWVRSKATQETELCEFFENFDKNQSSQEIPRGVFSLDDLKVPCPASSQFSIRSALSTFSHRLHIPPGSWAGEKAVSLLYDQVRKFDMSACVLFLLFISLRV